ncbi:MAG TPA: HNH endonuclease [Terriglobia bacterium]|nr:HNH endonuclease [Terriglobia bacterium]
MDRFEITFLDSYTDEALLAELRRVATLIPSGPLTRAVFKQFSKRVSVSTFDKRFGGWGRALKAAGISHLSLDHPGWEKKKAQYARNMSDDDLILEMNRVRALVNMPTLTADDFNQHSTLAGSHAIRNRFGSWAKALKKAGISSSSLGRRYTDGECFENLVNVWTHYGRQPTHREMKLPPSVVGPKAYVVRWGTWRKAVKAFVDWTNTEEQPSESHSEPQLQKTGITSVPPEDRHEIPLGLRWKVLVRDRFRCVSCGRSPANNLNVELHVDHAEAFGNNGSTTLDNLQTLCKDCNLGKGKSDVWVRRPSGERVQE